MNDKRVNQYLILPENGQRKDTKIAVEYNEDEIYEFLKQGYVIVTTEDFNKLIGNADREYLIADSGTVYPKPAPTEEELLEVSKSRKIEELKEQRDAFEVTPISYNGHLYDYDSKARERINVAIIALDQQGADAAIAWTTADNKEVTVTGVDLRSVLIEAAKRSSALHNAYRAAREKVLNATTKEEIKGVKLHE